MREHRDELAELKGFDISALDQLIGLVDRAEKAEIVWLDEQIKHRKPSMHETRDEAIRLRFRLAAAAHYVLPADSFELKDLQGFHRRRSLPSICYDLKVLAKIVDEHPGLFEAMPSLPERPGEKALELANLLYAGSYSDKLQKAMEARNQAFTLLALAVNEVRAGARFLFRHEPELLKRVTDGVTKKQRQRQKRAKRKQSESAETEES
jgi:hypothetical protein